MDEDQANINMLFNLGDRLIGMDLYEEAINVYADIVKLNRTHSQAWFLLGECLVVLGRDEESIDAFDRCLATQDDSYAEAARWQMAMAMSRWGGAYKGFKFDMALPSSGTSSQRPEMLNLSKFSRIHNLKIISVATNVYIDMGVWHRDEWGRDKVGWWGFRWTDGQLVFVPAFNDECMIGEAQTQDFAQRIVERWLDGWLKSCGVISYSYSMNIEEIRKQIVFYFLLRDKVKFKEKYESGFRWKDGTITFLPDEVDIGQSEIENEALQIARRWLEDKITNNQFRSSR